jgi:hypothetical protein
MLKQVLVSSKKLSVSLHGITTKQNIKKFWNRLSFLKKKQSKFYTQFDVFLLYFSESIIYRLSSEN